MYDVEGWPLCLNHYAIIQKIEGEQQNQRAAMMNFLMDQIDETTGISSGARIRMPQPVIHQGSMTQNIIKVDRSIVGTINTGNIQSLNQSLSNLQNYNDGALSKGLADLVNLALRSQILTTEQKQEVLDDVTFIVEQVQTPEQSRKKMLLNQVTNGLFKIISVSAELLTIWNAVHPILPK